MKGMNFQHLSLTSSGDLESVGLVFFSGNSTQRYRDSDTTVRTTLTWTALWMNRSVHKNGNFKSVKSALVFPSVDTSFLFYCLSIQ